MTEANLASNATSAGESLFDTLSRVRPQWVENRQGTVMVFIDGVNAGSAAQTLRTITVGSVREVRYIRPESASSRFGSGFEGGVIEVTLKQ